MSNQTSITKKDLTRTAFRTFFLQAAWNFERMQALGYCYVVLPVLEKLYKDDKEALKQAAIRNLEFFNTQPYLASIIIGTTLAMEERLATKKDIDPNSISAVKISMMGPLAGIGDSLFWFTIYPIAISLGCGIAADGNALGPILFLVIFNVFHIFTRFYGVYYGYKTGTNLLKDVSGNIMQRLSEAAGIVSLMVVGVMTATMVSFSLKLVLGGEGGLDVQAAVFDSIMPNILPLAIVLLTMSLLKKKVNPVLILLGFFVLGIVGSVLGIL